VSATRTRWLPRQRTRVCACVKVPLLSARSHRRTDETWRAIGRRRQLPSPPPQPPPASRPRTTHSIQSPVLGCYYTTHVSRASALSLSLSLSLTFFLSLSLSLIGTLLLSYTRERHASRKRSHNVSNLTYASDARPGARDLNAMSSGVSKRRNRERQRQREGEKERERERR